MEENSSISSDIHEIRKMGGEFERKKWACTEVDGWVSGRSRAVARVAGDDDDDDKEQVQDVVAERKVKTGNKRQQHSKQDRASPERALQPRSRPNRCCVG